MKMGKLDYLDNTYCTEKLINSTCLQRHNQLNLYYVVLFFVGVDRGKNCDVIRFCHDINNVQVLLDYRENSWN